MTDSDDFTDRSACPPAMLPDYAADSSDGATFSDERTDLSSAQKWQTLGYDETMALATRLTSLGPLWASDPGSIARVFGWHISEAAPGLYQLDTGPGTAKGYLYWRDGRAEGVEIPVTVSVPDNDALRLGYLFTLLSPALAEALGPSSETSSRRDEIVWTNNDLRVTLALSATDIRLFVTLKR
ncbi:DUF6301 family protein [Nocardia niigatensis]|uniref:DUF6301 family protein n=1 Tax=Nocardia niigatensis TaxID=209249 RepID=UPI0003015A11|nr:DUF6301 family protein [Nocardia niigatensis]